MKRFFLKVVPFIVFAGIVIGIFIIEVRSGKIRLYSPKPEAIATEIPESMSPTPTVTPTTPPTIKPSITPTVTPTVKPTLPPVSGPPGSGLSTINVHTEKGDFTATVLSLDLGSTRDSDCATDCIAMNVASYVARNGGFAGVNGTYLCPASYPECAGKTNSFDFPVYNTRLGHWINQGNFGYSGRSIVYFDGSGGHYLQNASSFSGGVTAGIVNNPGLLDGGNVQIDDAQSGLSDKQRSVGLKEGIGIRGTNTVLIVIALNVNMQQFAYVFKALGATGAMNLDEGGSTALYYGGHYVYGPGRDVPNAIIFASK